MSDDNLKETGQFHQDFRDARDSLNALESGVNVLRIQEYVRYAAFHIEKGAEYTQQAVGLINEAEKFLQNISVKSHPELHESASHAIADFFIQYRAQINAFVGSESRPTYSFL